MSELNTSLSWALTMAARRQGIVIDTQRLGTAIATATGQGDAPDIARLCRALNMSRPRHLAKPERSSLPLLCQVKEQGWGLLVDQRPDGRWDFLCHTGQSVVGDAEIIGGSFRLDFSEQGGKKGQQGFERVFLDAIGEFRPVLIEIVVASVVMSIIALGASIFSMQVYDRVIPTHGMATLIVLAIGVGLAILFELGMKFARSHIMDKVVSGLDAKLSQALYERLLAVRVDQLPGSVGSLAGQLRGYEQIRSFYTSQTLFTLVDLPLGLLFVLVIALIASPWMAMVPTVFGVVAILIGYLSNRKVVRLADKSAAASNLKTGLLVETVEGVETIKSGSGGWKFLSRWIDVSAESIRSDMAMRAIGDHAGYIAATLQQLSYSTTVIIGAFLVINGQITMGALIACSILGGRILAPVAMIPGLMVQRAHTKATLAGLEKIYALQTDQGSERQLTPDNLRGQFRIEEAKFTYAGSMLNAMTIDQLTINAGERVAVLGPIGAGKSTILRLLSGLYRPQQGRILLDGLDMANINRLTLNQHIGYLQQDHRLFVGTLSAQTDVSKIDSLAEVQALATLAMKAQLKISAYADDARKPVPTTVDYLAVGLVKPDGSALVTGDRLAALNSTLASNAINSPQAGDPAKLKGIVDAYARILDGSAANGAAPELDDYLKVGLSGVTAQNKGLLDGVIQKLGAERIKDQSVLQKAGAGVARIMALADGADNTAMLDRPSADDFAALGLSMGNAATAKDPDGSAAALLGSAIDRMPAASVATVGKLQALVDTVNKLMDNAAGVAGVAAPTVADLQLLGIDISAHSVARQGAILAAIGTSGTDGRQIHSVPAINALAERAVKALAKIAAYAQDNTGASLGKPTAEDYAAIGVAGVNATSVDAINAALATTLVDASRAGTQPQVQAIVMAYLKVLAAANGQRAIPDPVGSASLPTADELASLGVNIIAAVDAHRLSLLSTALDALSTERVNTPAKIDLINVSAGKMVAAAGNAAAAAALTLDDFIALGVQGLDEAFLTNVQALVAASDVSRIDSSARLQALVDGLLKDLKIIRNYADGVANNDATLGPLGTVLTPTADNYGRAGVLGVEADTLASINAAVKALGRSNLVDSKAKLQSVVDAYQHVFQAADGIAGNLPKPVTREELLRIGVPAAKLPDPLAAGLSPADSQRAAASLNLLVTALDAQVSRSAVSTPDKIANLADLATQVATIQDHRQPDEGYGGLWFRSHHQRWHGRRERHGSRRQPAIQSGRREQLAQCRGQQLQGAGRGRWRQRYRWSQVGAGAPGGRGWQ